MFCAVLVLNLGERCSRALGITRFDFAAAAGDAPADEHTERGRSLLRREQEVCGASTPRTLCCVWCFCCCLELIALPR